MQQINEKLVNWLFETNAVRVCPQDKPFWYTSGTIGPYYINTHFLYGSEEKANSLLKLIDSEKSDIFTCPVTLLDATLNNYENDAIYKGLIDELLEYIKKNIGQDSVDYISGGERRDWFFSLIISHFLKKPHITIYKDLKTVILRSGKTCEAGDLDGSRVLHIADLITEASSYQRAWIPAVENFRGTMKWSLVVVDRMQGGGEFLAGKAVQSHAMINIDMALFDKALKLGFINKEQYLMVEDYMKNPKESMRNFLVKNPAFLENALASDDKTRERAKLCIESKYYGDL